MSARKTCFPVILIPSHEWGNHAARVSHGGYTRVFSLCRGCFLFFGRPGGPSFLNFSLKPSDFSLNPSEKASFLSKTFGFSFFLFLDKYFAPIRCGCFCLEHVSDGAMGFLVSCFSHSLVSFAYTDRSFRSICHTSSSSATRRCLTCINRDGWNGKPPMERL